MSDHTDHSSPPFPDSSSAASMIDTSLPPQSSSSSAFPPPTSSSILSPPHPSGSIMDLTSPDHSSAYMMDPPHLSLDLSSSSPSSIPIPSSSAAALPPPHLRTSSSGSIGDPSSPSYSHSSHTAGRQVARKTLQAVGHSAIQLFNQASSSSFVQFSISKVQRLTTPLLKPASNLAASNWNAYGDPLLTKIDQKIDTAVNAWEKVQSFSAFHSVATNVMANPSNASSSSTILSPPTSSPTDSSLIDRSSSAAAHPSSTDLVLLDPANKQFNALYFSRLKERFVNSRWYAHVDEILLQNAVVKAFTERVGNLQRPAETFYHTITEEFTEQSSLDEFLHALKSKLGPAWDDRLTPLAKGFYSTAKAVSTVVGAGRFFGGALQLGRAKVNAVMDDLLSKWDRMLSMTDEYVDRWLPDRSLPPAAIPAHRALEAVTEPVYGSPPVASSALLDHSADIDASDISDLDGSESDLDGDYHSHTNGRSSSGPDEDGVFAMDMETERYSANHSSNLSPPYINRLSASSPAISGRPARERKQRKSIRNNDQQNSESSGGSGASDGDSDSDGLLSVPGSNGMRRVGSKKRTTDELYSLDDNDMAPHDNEDDETEQINEMTRSMLVLSTDNHSYQHSLSSSAHRTMAIAHKVGKRIRHRILSFSSIRPHRNPMENNNWVDELKTKLVERAWFNGVDDILMQNMFVRALSTFIRPAEHFFNTSLQIYSQRSSVTLSALPEADAIAITSAAVESIAKEQIPLSSSPHSPLPDSPSNSSFVGSPPPSVSLPPSLPANDANATAAFLHAYTSASSSNAPVIASAPFSSSAAASSSSSQSMLPLPTPPLPSSSESIGVDAAATAKKIFDDFIHHLRSALGASWDDRLIVHAKSFLAIASVLSIQHRARQPSQ